MSKFWVYKCNSKGWDYQSASGDWAQVFASNRAREWGTTKHTPELAKVSKGDTILAYQSDRNELVGVAKVVRLDPDGKYRRLILKPVQTIGIRVRPLRQGDSRVARISAFQPGPIRTLYPISPGDTDTLLRSARIHLRRNADNSHRNTGNTKKGAGFGSPNNNKMVERAAVRVVTCHYQDRGYSVRDVSSENCGYDLLCKSSREESHVEVKGARGDGQQFVITPNELDAWSKDKKFVLAFVGNALSAKPSISFFPRAATQKEFSIRPLSYIARREPIRARRSMSITSKRRLSNR